MSQPCVTFGDGQAIALGRNDDDEAIRRFREIKADIRDRHGTELEITNGIALSVLCDIFWLHAEHPSADGGQTGTRAVVADGGERE